MNLCIICNIDEIECGIYILGKINICRKCNTCRKCVKKKEIVCNVCTVKCKKCEKILLKDNWPEDIIKNGKCNKCFHLCKLCNKYASGKKSIIKNNNRYCLNCFNKNFIPKDHDKKYKYKIITKKGVDSELDSLIFLNWRKIKKSIICESCNENFWKPVNFNNEKCNKCTRKKTEKLEDPSDDYKKYILSEKDKKKWVLIEEKKKCIQCFSSIWIKQENLKSKHFYCRNCSPQDERKKCKYDDKSQRWIPYRILINCHNCKNDKWIFSQKEKTLCKQCED